MGILSPEAAYLHWLMPKQKFGLGRDGEIHRSMPNFHPDAASYPLISMM